MQTFLIERTIPPAFDTTDPDQVAMHARWAVDAYRAVGAFWLGGVVTEDRMWSLVTAETQADLDRYRTSLGIAATDMVVRRVARALGPYFAAPAGSVRAPALPLAGRVDTPTGALKSGAHPKGLGRQGTGGDTA